MTNQYTYAPPFSEEELYHAYILEGMTQREAAERFGTTQKVIWRAMKKMGLSARRAVARNQQGPMNNNWRGGRVLQGQTAKRGPFNDRGYWYVYDPKHPNATKSGYVAEHITIIVQEIGRPLKKGECIHHINLRKEDNRLENLVLMTHKEHALIHAQLEFVAAQLLETGLISFSPDHGYSLSP